MRLLLEALEDRTLLSVTIAPANNNGNGYAGLDFSHSSGGYYPPDSQGAAGPTNYVETVNQTIAIYSPKATGASEASDSLSHFFGTVGGLPVADSIAHYSDPVVAYDDNMPEQTVSTGRFIIEDQNVDSYLFNGNNTLHKSVLDIAVSKSASPQTLTASDWNFYQINTANGAWDPDYPGNIGFNNDAVVTTLNMGEQGQSPQVQIVSLNAADLLSGVSQSQLRFAQNTLANTSNLRPAAEHDVAAGAPEWLITEGLIVYKMTNVLSNSATFATTQVAVNSYTTFEYPLNPNGSVITQNIDSKIQKVAEAKNTLVATQAVGASATQDDIRWYSLDVSSGTPTLKDQGDINAGNNTYLYYPSIDINPSGQIGLTYMRSGTDSLNDYMSMYIAGRTPSDPAGTMEAPVLVPSGKGQANYSEDGRAGDLSGINIDPTDGSFWAVNEFANTTALHWGTAITNFALGSPYATQVSLSGIYNRTGIVNDGTPFSGGLDGSGHALSEQLVGPSVTFGGAYYALGPAGSVDDVAAAGQVITLPTGYYSSLSFVGTGVNGNQASQNFTVTYTDNTTKTFTQSLSDWHTPQNYSGESQIASMNYRDNSDGTKTSLAFYLYGYTFTLDSTKQVKSITLPTDTNVEVLAIDLVRAPTPVSLSGIYDRTGIVNDGTTFSGGLDGNGHAASSSFFLNSTVSYGGATYNIGPVGSPDVVSAAGQVITLPTGYYSSLAFLATGVNGNQQNLTFTVTYTDNTTDTFTQSFSDWFSPQHYQGESTAVTMTHRDNSDGTTDNRTFYLSAYSFALNTGKEVKSITLPTDTSVEIFAIDLIP